MKGKCKTVHLIRYTHGPLKVLWCGRRSVTLPAVWSLDEAESRPSCKACKRNKRAWKKRWGRWDVP